MRRHGPLGRSASQTLEDGTLHVIWLAPGKPVPPGYVAKRAASAASCTPRRQDRVIASYVSPSGKAMAERERKRVKQRNKRRRRAARRKADRSKHDAV